MSRELPHISDLSLLTFGKATTHRPRRRLAAPRSNQSYFTLIGKTVNSHLCSASGLFLKTPHNHQHTRNPFLGRVVIANAGDPSRSRRYLLTCTQGCRPKDKRSAPNGTSRPSLRNPHYATVVSPHTLGESRCWRRGRPQSGGKRVNLWAIPGLWMYTYRGGLNLSIWP